MALDPVEVVVEVIFGPEEVHRQARCGTPQIVHHLQGQVVRPGSELTVLQEHLVAIETKVGQGCLFEHILLSI